MDQKCATRCVTQTTTRNNNERKWECCSRVLVFQSLSICLYVCLSVCLSIKHTQTSNPVGSGGRGYMRSQVGTGTLSLETEQRISGRQAMDLSGPLSRLATLQLSTDVNVSAGGLHGIKHCLTVQSPLWPHGLPLELMYVFRQLAYFTICSCLFSQRYQSAFSFYVHPAFVHTYWQDPAERRAPSCKKKKKKKPFKPFYK